MLNGAVVITCLGSLGLFKVLTVPIGVDEGTSKYYLPKEYHEQQNEVPVEAFLIGDQVEGFLDKNFAIRCKALLI